jgi:hypothetical protein
MDTQPFGISPFKVLLLGVIEVVAGLRKHGCRLLVTWDNPLCQLWDHPEGPPTPTEKTLGWASDAAARRLHSVS